MVYKNFFYRLFFSVFFIFLYLIAYNNKILIFLFGTFIYLLILYEIFKFFKISLKLILFYLFVSYLCFCLYFFNFFDYLIFNIFVFSIIIFDSFSYLTGKFYGKNFIFKSISPKKTLEGYLGGFFFSNFFFIFFFFFTQIEIKITLLIILVNFTIFISMIGDLIESYFKRINSIKDSSTYLPGHGGFFDRFDSFIASIIFLPLLSYLNL
jgi:phosphatidate cytidylyltransferase